MRVGGRWRAVLGLGWWFLWGLSGACGRVGFVALPFDETADCPTHCASENALARCVDGVCELTCHLGFADCDGRADNGCETPVAEALDTCGACDVVCDNDHGETACAVGICQPACEPGFGDCDGTPANGCETELTSDAHCGTCDMVCEHVHGQNACVDGACMPTCDSGFADCDGDGSNGCEANEMADPRHCGGCDIQCDTGDICMDGACAPSLCEPGLGECDGDTADLCETDVASSKDDCGFCGNHCPDTNGTTTCASGSCSVTACSTDYGDCDNSGDNGCETDLKTSRSDCGACDRSCDNPHGTTSCSDGTCQPTCAIGYDSCDGDEDNGCEASLADPDHCGRCDNRCPDGVGVATCSEGVCGVRCDLTGTFAVRLSTPTSWYGPAVEPESGVLRAWLRLQVVHVGTQADVHVNTCGLDIPSVGMALLPERIRFTYPNSLFDSGLLSGATARMTLANTAPGADLSLPDVSLVTGTAIGASIDTSWPANPTPSDDDNDSHPGVTALYDDTGILALPLTGPTLVSARARRPYVAGRLAFSLAGALTDCDGGRGVATTHHLDTHVFGCELESGAQCSATQASFLNDNLPTLIFDPATYTMVKLADEADCAAVRAALP